MKRRNFKADLDGVAMLSGILSNLFQRTTISLGLQASEWSDPDGGGLFEKYLVANYSDEKVRYNKQTNLPRSIWDSVDMTWEIFLEAIDTLNPEEVFFEMAIKHDSAEIPVVLQYPLHTIPRYDGAESGVNLKKDKKSKDTDVIWATTMDFSKVDSFPALVLRDYLATTRMTWRELDVALDKAVDKLKEEGNPTVSKARLKGPVFSSKLTWKKMIEVFETLQADTINFTLKIVMNKSREGDASLLWRF